MDGISNKFSYVNDFDEGAKFYYEKEKYKLASFNLHQTCENYIYAIRPVNTPENPKQHNLTKLLNSVKKYSNEFVKVFSTRYSRRETTL